MSERADTHERSERPTPKRLERAKREGEVPRSRELGTVLVVLAGAGVCALFGRWMLDRLEALLAGGLASPTGNGLAAADALEALERGMLGGFAVLAPLLLAAALGAVAAPALLGGFTFAGGLLAPKLERLDPSRGLKRIFSMQGLMELLKALLKVALLSCGAAFLLLRLAPDLRALGLAAPLAGIAETGSLMQRAFLALAAGLALVALVDVPYQVFAHRKRLRMSREEIKEELKESEGNPEMRARMKRLQRERAGRRMMQDVPSADVVITNPIRFAVALRYTDRPERAPRVVAKGRGPIAARIRELAEQNGVPVCAAPPLARAVYFTTEIGAEIPAALYLAVARVLAWVMQLERAHKLGRRAPDFPADLPVPAELSAGRGGEA
ncbi:MAG TPA: flagellar biosynthesis protein FlhB [Gammaproteobacteria bacterium]|nr:flagellar biosynthesis protein FlhB [Gammaproteobacteria bacterium]